MRGLLVATLIASVVTAGCGTAGGGSGGGTQHPPTAQLGPYAPITSDTAPSLNVPFVLTNGLGQYDDAEARADGQSIVLFVTSSDPTGATSSIARTTTTDVLKGFAAPANVLTADQAWENGALAHPSLLALPDGALLLFYAAGGSIGVARAAAGVTPATATFTKLGQLLSADGVTERGPLTSPSAVQIGARVRLYYVAGGVVWAADSAIADWATGSLPTMTRLDAGTLGLPTAKHVRAPFVVATGSLNATIDRARARIVTTEAGRTRYDVYFSGPATTGSGYCAYAAAYAADEPMEVGANPLIINAGLSAPTVVPFGGDALLLYTQPDDGLNGIALAVGPEVAF